MTHPGICPHTLNHLQIGNGDFMREATAPPGVRADVRSQWCGQGLTGRARLACTGRGRLRHQLSLPGDPRQGKTREPLQARELQEPTTECRMILNGARIRRGSRRCWAERAAGRAVMSAPPGGCQERALCLQNARCAVLGRQGTGCSLLRCLRGKQRTGRLGEERDEHSCEAPV